MKSRFLNVSPRAYIRQTDSVNILPGIVRTGYENEIGIASSPFSERDSTVIFEENKVLLAPYMIPAPLAAASGFLTGNLYVTGTYQDSSAYFDQKISNPSIFPYKEADNAASFGNLAGEDEGFPESIFPGFSSPDSDKIALVFDISAKSSTTLIKMGRTEGLKDPSGPFFGSAGSGFAYYNNNLNQWADVGIRDPSTGATKTYDPILAISGSSAAESGYFDLTQTAERNIVSQFSSSPYSITSEGPYYAPQDVEALYARGYDRIGEPTSFFGAPSAPRYHAPSSYTYKLSERISSPLAIDRISVKIPVTAYRTQIPCTGSGTTDSGFGRDIDNYVFFVYLQNRSNASVDSSQDVSSSIRYLIGKESFCFYNQDTLNEVSSGLAPIHSYGQAIPFSMAKNVATVTSASVVTVAKQAEINMTFRPATFNSTFGTTSKMAGKVKVLGGSGNPITGSVFIQNFWRGGQQGIGFQRSLSRLDGTSNLNIKSGNVSPRQENLLAIPSPRSLVASFWDGIPQAYNTGSGFTSGSGDVSTTSKGDFTQITPVVIFPGDELVFGIESGANSNMFSPGRSYSGVDNDVLNVTGSSLLIRSGEARVTIYGSLIANKRELLASTNQHLGSDAVQEDIHEEGPVDQFDTCDKTILSASYVDNIFNGNMALGNRRRVALSTRNQNWITGSLQRNVRLVSENSTYYDTLVPAVPVISGGIENSTSANYNDAFSDPAALKIISGSLNGFAFENNRSSNDLMQRSFTYENVPSSDQKRIRNLKLVVYQDVIGSGITYLRTHLASESKFVLFYNGYNPSIPILQAYNKNYSGATSLRYGLMSPRLIGPSAIFRRDHFGFMRDMLEQQRDSKIIFTRKGKDTITQAVVVATFVSSSSDTITDPINTQCSNLSFECTSSLPFIDDNQPHNRGNDVPVFIPKFGANNLIFGVTGSFGAQ